MRRRLFRRSDTGAGARLIQGTRGIASLSRARMQVRVNKVLVGESGGDEQAAQLLGSPPPPSQGVVARLALPPELGPPSKLA